MATPKVRISTYVPEPMSAYLRQRCIDSDIPLGALLRQAIRLMIYADEKKVAR
jgi:hypothetical protein